MLLKILQEATVALASTFILGVAGLTPHAVVMVGARLLSRGQSVKPACEQAR